ncbi:MAG TPA: hypothetical protein VIQ31_00070, partial [Phormidium sp.]
KVIMTLGFSLLSLAPFQEVKAQNNQPTCPRPLRGHFVVRVPSSGGLNFVRSQLGDAIVCSVNINGQTTTYVQAGKTSDRATAQRYLSMIKTRYTNAFLVSG